MTNKKIDTGETAGKPVVVTTDHRGVFFGYVSAEVLQDAQAVMPETLTLRDARMCVYWTSDVRGVLGLAATGPNKRCRISPAVPSLTLSGLTAILDVAEEAAKNWEAAPWG